MVNYVFSVIKNDDNIRAVVLTGNGKGFCAGADLTTMGTLSAEDSRDYIIDNYKPILNNFLNLGKGAKIRVPAGPPSSLTMTTKLWS